jgi:hypothetical protein
MQSSNAEPVVPANAPPVEAVAPVESVPPQPQTATAPAPVAEPAVVVVEPVAVLPPAPPSIPSRVEKGDVDTVVVPYSTVLFALAVVALLAAGCLIVNMLATGAHVAWMWLVAVAALLLGAATAARVVKYSATFNKANARVHYTESLGVAPCFSREMYCDVDAVVNVRAEQRLFFAGRTMHVVLLKVNGQRDALVDCVAGGDAAAAELVAQWRHYLDTVKLQPLPTGDDCFDGEAAPPPFRAL